MGIYRISFIEEATNVTLAVKKISAINDKGSEAERSVEMGFAKLEAGKSNLGDVC